MSNDMHAVIALTSMQITVLKTINVRQVKQPT